MDDEVVKSITGSGEISYGVWSNHVHGQTELCDGQIDYRQQLINYGVMWWLN